MRSQLLIHCEPLFRLVNDGFRGRSNNDVQSIKKDFWDMFAKLDARAKPNKVEISYYAIKPVLAYFADQMISKFSPILKETWASTLGVGTFLKDEDRLVTGDTEFTNRWRKVLEQAQRYTTPEIKEQLLVFFVCAHQGFRPAENDRERFIECELITRPYITEFLDRNISGELNDGENLVDTSTLFVRKADRYAAVSIAFFAALLITIICYTLLYGWASEELSSNLDNIETLLTHHPR